MLQTKWLKKESLTKSKVPKSTKHLMTGKRGPLELQKDNIPKDAKKQIKQSFMKDKSTHKKQKIIHLNGTAQVTHSGPIHQPYLMEPPFPNEEPFYRNEYMTGPAFGPHTWSRRSSDVYGIVVAPLSIFEKQVMQ